MCTSKLSYNILFVCYIKHTGTMLNVQVFQFRKTFSALLQFGMRAHKSVSFTVEWSFSLSTRCFLCAIWGEYLTFLGTVSETIGADV